MIVRTYLLQKNSYLYCALNFIIILFLMLKWGKKMKKKWPRICLNSKITSIHIYSINYYSQVALDEKSKGKQKVCHTAALPFTWKLILRQKKNYVNSNISPCKGKRKKKNTHTHLIFKRKSLKKETKILQDIIITL